MVEMGQDPHLLGNKSLAGEQPFQDGWPAWASSAKGQLARSQQGCGDAPAMEDGQRPARPPPINHGPGKQELIVGASEAPEREPSTWGCRR